MANYSESYEVVLRDFQRQGIPIEVPGFYDHPAFMMRESRDKTYLNNYARFVQKRLYSQEYLKRAEIEVPVIADAFQAELAKNGRIGACVDASMALSRILEREGFWNYAVNGALVIELPKSSGNERIEFWAFDMTIRKFAAGHAWIFVPPFSVIDITVKQQPYEPAHIPFIPDKIHSLIGPTFRAGARDIMSPSATAYFYSQGIAQSDFLTAARADLPKFLTTFPGFLVTWEQTIFRYVSVGIGASDCPLEGITNMRYGNRYAIDVYNDIIKPQLASIRGEPRESVR